MADGGEGTLDALLGRARRRAAHGAGDRPARPRDRGALRAAGRRVDRGRRGRGRQRADAGRRGRARRLGGDLLRHRRADRRRRRGRRADGGRRRRRVGDDRRRRRRDRGAARRRRRTPRELVLVCDVRTPWEQAPRVFGPQKGADPKTVKRLEQRLDELAAELRRDPRGEPMTGAAGGLAGGLWAEFGAKLVPGAPYVLDAVGFDAAMRAARYVVTGEGRIDEQTLPARSSARSRPAAARPASAATRWSVRTASTCSASACSTSARSAQATTLRRARGGGARAGRTARPAGGRVEPSVGSRAFHHRLFRADLARRHEWPHDGAMTRFIALSQPPSSCSWPRPRTRRSPQRRPS